MILLNVELFGRRCHALHKIERIIKGIIMPDFRRAFLPGGTFFFTVVTYKRQRFLPHMECRNILRDVINAVKLHYPFSIDGWVLLPDHIHCIWSLPEGDNDFSKRWGLIKAGFSKKTKELLHRNEWMTDAKRKYREITIWQRRFWVKPRTAPVFELIHDLALKNIFKTNPSSYYSFNSSLNRSIDRQASLTKERRSPLSTVL